MSIAKINARALLDLGLDKQTVLALQHMLTQTGNEVGATPLPRALAQSIALAPSVTNLDRVVSAATAAIAELVIDQLDPPLSNNDLLRRLDDLASEVQSLTIGNDELQRRIATLENGVN